MKKIIFIIFSLILICNFTQAQTRPYFSVRKVPSGVMIGVEVINQDSALNPRGYKYEWTFSNISATPKETLWNVTFVNLDKFFNSLFLTLHITKPLSEEKYSFPFVNLDLQVMPKVKIVRKSNGLMLPLVTKLKTDDILAVITDNFSSKRLNYVWELNGAFVANTKEIKISDLKEQKGIIRVKVYGSLTWEKAEDSAVIQIE